MFDYTKDVVEALKSYYGEVGCALNYNNNFELLVAVILSAQCTDKRVNSVTPALFERFPDANAFANATPEQLKPYIYSCGFYNNKSKSIIAAAKSIMQHFGGEVPSTLEELQQLEGVGRKTANVMLAEAFGGQAIAVDTHVFRVSRRIGLADFDNKDVYKTERQLQEVLPMEQWTLCHHLLINHGRTICKARNPLCNECPINKYCQHKTL